MKRLALTLVFVFVVTITTTYAQTYSQKMDVFEALAIVEVAHREGGNCKLKVESYGVEDRRSKDCILYFSYAKARISDAIQALERDMRMPKTDIQEALKNAQQVIEFDEYIQAAEDAYEAEKSQREDAIIVDKNSALETIEGAYYRSEWCKDVIVSQGAGHDDARRCVAEVLELVNGEVREAVDYLKQGQEVNSYETETVISWLEKIAQHKKYFEYIIEHP